MLNVRNLVGKLNDGWYYVDGEELVGPYGTEAEALEASKRRDEGMLEGLMSSGRKVVLDADQADGEELQEF